MTITPDLSNTVELQDNPATPTFQGRLPLAAAQPGIWYAHHLEGESTAIFNVARYLDIQGSLDETLFTEAVALGLADADTIHSTFDDDGTPGQHPGAAASAPLEVVDFRADGADEARTRMHQDLATPVSLTDGSALYRQTLFRVGENRWFWYQRFHHILLDGYSFTAITAHISAIYRALVSGTEIPASPFTAFSLVVDQESVYRGSADEEQDAAFWRDYCSELPTPVSLAGAARALETAPATWAPVRRHELRLDGAQMAAVTELSRTHHVTWADVLTAAVGSYIGRMGSARNVVLGVPFMGRTKSALRTSGPVVTVLPVTVPLARNAGLGEVARLTARNIAQARRHYRYGAEQIMRDANLVGAETGLYGHVVNIKIFDYTTDLAGASVTTRHLSAGPVDDLEFSVLRDGEETVIEIEAHPGRYSDEDLADHARRLQAWILSTTDPGAGAVDGLPIATADEQDLILHSWGAGTTVPHSAAPVGELLDARAAETPTETAVVCGHLSLTFAELTGRANSLARYLISQGVGPDTVVAIALPRSLESVVSIAAVVASGAAYLPLDLDYPQDRLAYMVEDAAPVILLTNSKVDTTFAGDDVRVLGLDDPDIVSAASRLPGNPVSDADRTRQLHPKDLAYVIYTSGSTGRPKGVQSTHEGLRNLLENHAADVFGSTIATLAPRRVRAAHTASFSFDSSWEQLIWLYLGHELHVFDDDTRRDPQAVVEAVRAARIDALDVTPSFGAQLLESGLLAPAEHHPALFLIGGEAASPALWKTLRETPGTHSHNFYGPTEYSVDTLGANVLDAEVPVVGRPIGNTSVYVLDAALRPLPAGVPGELYISGPGLARGYLGRPDLTAARFVADPHRDGERMYRTGDLVQWRPDGTIDYLSRVDDQVKVRGFRVELGEVEDAMTGVESVVAAAVIAEPLGHTNRLIGYFVTGAGTALRRDQDPPARVREILSATLPDYLVPAILIHLDELPLTVNGKLDRAALPAPAAVASAPGRTPTTAEEELLCSAIATVVGMPVVSVDDDFFSLGGDSISAMAVCGAARRGGYQLRPRDVFALRTPAAMATALTSLATSQVIAPPSPEGPVPPLPIMKWFAESASGAGARYAQGVCVTVPAALSRQDLARSLGALAAAHPALRARLNGQELHIPSAADSPVPDVREINLPAGATESALNDAADLAFREGAADLDPVGGSMVYAAIIAVAGQSRRLVLVLHHLIVDGVSWRTLLPELGQVVDAVLTWHAPELPAEETSLRQWTQSLHAQIPARRDELAYWTGQLAAGTGRIAAGLDPALDTHGTAGTARLLLGQATTTALLEQLPDAYRATIDEVLLATVMLAAAEQVGTQSLGIARETHGRESDGLDLDLERTVGWLTAEYPLRLDLGAIDAADALAGGTGLFDVVRSIKQAVREVPDHGLGFGILRYLDEQTGPELDRLFRACPPSLLVNYLGRFANDEGHFTPISGTGVFADSFAVDIDPAIPLSHPLELNMFLDGKQLALSWTWAQRLLRLHDVEALTEAMERAAMALLRQAKAAPVQALATSVPADVPGTGLTLAEVHRLEQVHGPLEAALPLGPLHEGLLFHAQLGESASYSSVTVLDFEGPLDSDRMRQAVGLLLDKHPQLGAGFDSGTGSRPVQVIPHAAHRREFIWEETSCAGTSSETVETTAKDIEQAEANRHFDVARGPLLAAHLLRVSGTSARLYLSAHHLVVDGWSTPLIIRDLLTAYEDRILPGPTALSAYRDAVRRMETSDEDRAVWARAMAGCTPTMLAPTFPSGNSSAGESPLFEISTVLEECLAQQIAAVARRVGATPNTVFQMAYAETLAQLTGRHDVIFGSTVSGRDNQHDQDIIGLFTNTLPVRITVDRAKPLALQLTDVQQAQSELREHSHIGLAEVQQLAGAGTLFDTLFVMENYPAESSLYDAGASGLRLTTLNNRGYTHYPVTLLVLPEPAGYRLVLEHRLDQADGGLLLERFRAALASVVSDAQEAPSRLGVLLPAERDLVEAANTTSHVVPAATLRSLLQDQGSMAPGNLAITSDEGDLSYAQVRLRVVRLARRLRQAGVRTGDIVAVALPRSTNLTVSILAVIEAGAAYLPLDTSYPAERLQFMVDDAKPRLLLTSALAGDLITANVPSLVVDRTEADVEDDPVSSGSSLGWREDVEAELTPGHPAYVIYTSGSTGRPKGVQVPHGAIVNRLLWMQHEYPLTAADVVMQKTPSSFDVSVWEFFWPFMVGAGQLIAPPQAHRDPSALCQLIRDGGVSIIHFVPSMLAAFLQEPSLQAQTGHGSALPSLRHVFCSGEALSAELAASFSDVVGAELHNLYGPTEAAVDVTAHRWAGPVPGALTGSVPIGSPVWNTQLHVLDPLLRPAPLGVAGELYLAGAQLATAYLGRPALTAERYVADPFAEGQRMYRTGDMVRRLPDGSIEYLGRTDDQVKIRGQRIEPGEIETVLAALPGVRTAVVIARSSTAGTGLTGADHRILVGYLVPDDPGTDHTELLRAVNAAALSSLPTHMVPAAMVVLPELPLSSNGKLDRRALPAPDMASGTGRAPAAGLETTVAEAFGSVLGVDGVQATDDFFALGGHSLLAMRLAAELGRTLDRRVHVGSIMASSSVEALAAQLGTGTDTNAAFDQLLQIRPGNAEPLVCIHPASGFAWQYKALASHLDDGHGVIGLQSPRPDGPLAHATGLTDVVDSHYRNLRAAQPHGPYRLLGYSLGGTIAHALAARLQAEGEIIAFLGLLDTYPPEGQDWDADTAAEAEAEADRERAGFLEAVPDQEPDAEREAMFTDIVANYADAVRLLKTATSPVFHGAAELFVAERTLPDGFDPEEAWGQRVDGLRIHRLDCSHEDIVSPEMLPSLAPALSAALAASRRIERHTATSTQETTP
ncbi:amino acid adenylation domain-containing protein [Paenarthrobacter sp. NPDC089714]|uniref:amino acid adenylation domain-containing protein n=1 Tax=Paenarthrobacter sp. NPDC089714 TaxID=3364377 RepID=UPI00381F947D